MRAGLSKGWLATNVWSRGNAWEKGDMLREEGDLVYFLTSTARQPVLSCGCFMLSRCGSALVKHIVSTF